MCSIFNLFMWKEVFILENPTKSKLGNSTADSCVPNKWSSHHGAGAFYGALTILKRYYDLVWHCHNFVKHNKFELFIIFFNKYFDFLNTKGILTHNVKSKICFESSNFLGLNIKFYLLFKCIKLWFLCTHFYLIKPLMLVNSIKKNVH